MDLSQHREFARGWYAANMWYYPNDFKEDVSSSEYNNVGYLEGSFIAPEKEIHGDEKCAICGVEIFPNGTCVTIAYGETVKRAVHYHLPKCCNGFSDRPTNISVAIDKPPYSEHMEENIRESLTSKVSGTLVLMMILIAYTKRVVIPV